MTCALSLWSWNFTLDTDATTPVWIGHLLGRRAASQTRTALIQSVLADRGEAWKEMDLSIDKENEGMFQCHLKLGACGPAASRCYKKRCYRHAPVSSLLPIGKVPKWCAILANFRVIIAITDHFMIAEECTSLLSHSSRARAYYPYTSHQYPPSTRCQNRQKRYTPVFTHIVCRSTQ